MEETKQRWIVNDSLASTQPETVLIFFDRKKLSKKIDVP